MTTRGINCFKRESGRISLWIVWPASAAGCSHYYKSLSEMPRDWPSTEMAIDVQMSIRCSSSRQKRRLLENMLKPAQLAGEGHLPHFLGIIIILILLYSLFFLKIESKRITFLRVGRH